MAERQRKQCVVEIQVKFSNSWTVMVCKCHHTGSSVASQHYISQRCWSGLNRADISRTAATLKEPLLVWWIRDTSASVVKRCRHASYCGDQSRSLHLQDNLSLTSIPPGSSVIPDPLLHLWSGKGPLKRDEAPGSGFYIQLPAFSLLLMSSSHFIVTER